MFVCSRAFFITRYLRPLHTSKCPEGLLKARSGKNTKSEAARHLLKE